MRKKYISKYISPLIVRLKKCGPIIRPFNILTHMWRFYRCWFIRSLNQWRLTGQ